MVIYNIQMKSKLSISNKWMALIHDKHKLNLDNLNSFKLCCKPSFNFNH